MGFSGLIVGIDRGLDVRCKVSPYTVSEALDYFKQVDRNFGETGDKRYDDALEYVISWLISLDGDWNNGQK